MSREHRRINLHESCRSRLGEADPVSIARSDEWSRQVTRRAVREICGVADDQVQVAWEAVLGGQRMSGIGDPIGKLGSPALFRRDRWKLFRRCNFQDSASNQRALIMHDTANGKMDVSRLFFVYTGHGDRALRSRLLKFREFICHRVHRFF